MREYNVQYRRIKGSVWKTETGETARTTVKELDGSTAARTVSEIENMDINRIILIMAISVGQQIAEIFNIQSIPMQSGIPLQHKKAPQSSEAPLLTCL